MPRCRSWPLGVRCLPRSKAGFSLTRNLAQIAGWAKIEHQNAKRRAEFHRLGTTCGAAVCLTAGLASPDDPRAGLRGHGFAKWPVVVVEEAAIKAAFDRCEVIAVLAQQLDRMATSRAAAPTSAAASKTKLTADRAADRAGAANLGRRPLVFLIGAFVILQSASNVGKIVQAQFKSVFHVCRPD